MLENLDDPIRLHLLRGVRKFVDSASKIGGVQRIALVGSLATEKENPKDADVLVTISEDVDINRLATAGRKLKGHGQARNSGADIFLCSPDGEYLGRICSYRDCHIRRSCDGTQCQKGTRICDDLHVLHFAAEVIAGPPLELWPAVVKRRPVPKDVEDLLC